MVLVTDTGKAQKKVELDSFFSAIIVSIIYGVVAKAIVKEDGSFDTAELGKIMSEKETAAAQAKEQEIAKGSTNPGGGTAGGNKDNEKTADVENAEKITFGSNSATAEAKNHYVI